jgi:hypothetical protein
MGGHKHRHKHHGRHQRHGEEAMVADEAALASSPAPKDRRGKRSTAASGGAVASPLDLKGKRTGENATTVDLWQTGVHCPLCPLPSHQTHFCNKLLRPGVATIAKPGRLSALHSRRDVPPALDATLGAEGQGSFVPASPAPALQITGGLLHCTAQLTQNFAKLCVSRELPCTLLM